MREDLTIITQLKMEHNQFLQNMRDSIATAERIILEAGPNIMTEINAGKARKFEQFLDTLNIAFSEHMQTEEDRILPIITNHAKEIFSRGLITEHEVIRQYLAVLRDNARDFTFSHENMDNAILESKKAGIVGKLQSVRLLLEDHIKKQEMIYELVRLTLDSIEEEKVHGS